MMIFDKFQDLVDEAGSRYGLVIAVTKRARQLKDGAKPLVNYPCKKSVSVATQEMIEGAVTVSKQASPANNAEYSILDSIE